MRRRWASQSAQRNAPVNHELHSSPLRSADSSTQPAATSSQEAHTSPRPRSSSASPGHLRQRGDSAQSRPAQHNMSLTSDDLAVADGHPAQPPTAPGFAKPRALQFRPKPPPKPKANPGLCPRLLTLRSAHIPLKTSPSPIVKYPAPQCTAQALAAPPPAKKSRISPELQCGGLPPPPTPPLPRSISGVGFSMTISEGGSSKSPAAQPRPLPSAQAALLAPKPRRVKVSSVRRSLATRMQTCGTIWLQLVYKLASASTLLVSVSTTAHASEHLLAVIRSNAPGTLERYLRIASLFILFLESSVSLASVLDFLAIARASHSQDLEVHRISAESSIKALRWFVRQAQWDCLSNALHSPVIRAYTRRGTAQERREALPIPWALITGWEERACDPTAPLTTKAVLGAALLATHASLRFGDLQRVEFSSLSLSTSALHGICFATKTTTHGQPFAVTLAGITGRNLSSCWTLHWLAALQSLVTPHLQPGGSTRFPLAQHGARRTSAGRAGPSILLHRITLPTLRGHPTMASCRQRPPPWRGAAAHSAQHEKAHY